MNKFKLFLLCIITIWYLPGCKLNNSEKTKVVIYTSVPLNTKLSIKRIAFGDEIDSLVDSATIKNNHDSLVLYVSKNEDRAFRITLSGSYLQMIIVNDSKLIRVHINSFFNQYTIQGSKATASLNALGDKRIAIIKVRNLLGKKIDSLSKLNVDRKIIDPLKAAMELNNQELRNGDLAYADTVSNPAAFMEVNGLIDFENDFEGFKKFMLKAAARFPNYKPIRQAKDDAVSTAKIFEEEYEVGDQLPHITLPNEVGIPYSTSALDGRYYLIDFWSTWCNQCLLFTKAEYKVLQKHSDVNLAVVSVALDDQRDVWKKIIPKNKFNWIQLIDQKMWQGTAVRTLKFDSIPFNFLVSPRGKIMAKAIKPDSLESVISRLDLNKK
ncbi:TlpA family protein disulfide reductase [Mucilaginibacter lappiensis]|uniref:Thiol-disulfide isomerase/thioredoxin n=1 Tax=Mucilaginibacter lappiensis TaxID=354630 RepID=A0A841JED6_9SPHI|nr:TlpA disulfide reductase family protein [Mucilaginibacter lappiensis]MBB6129277.1 thiol-disulfide isomerase/thioredoxin [Mucilaginibacter lappiensis]